MKKAIIILLVLGLALMVSGFVYGIVCFNLPHQDPTLAMQKAWEHDVTRTERIADILYISGAASILAGIALLIYRATKYFSEREKSKK